LRQLRELIKDLWYRNRQERERGDLDIIRQKIDLLTEMNLSPKPVQILAVSVSEDTQQLKRLIEDGKLTLPDEAPPKLEKPKTTRQRKPRRKPGDTSR
jgi:dephospho-CoA kinase